ncbi:carbonic anhydrase [Aurantiacibacter arachoides]|nr:carbonic anhydrase [Aurantiacibacter arachoides]
MFSRRDLITTGSALTAATLVTGATASAHARSMPPAADPITALPPTDLTPDQALALLRQGNAAFLRGEQPQVLPNPRRRLEMAAGQSPFAAYVTCSDSRVPPELLFGRGLGELFIIRNAGNTVDTVALGSIEYAVAVLGVPLVVVMGHESCGAVKAATEVVTDNATFPGSIGPMIEPIIPAVLAARGEDGDLLNNAIRANVRRVVRQLRQHTDPLLLEPQREGRLKVVGAYYDLNDGSVDFFDLP